MPFLNKSTLTYPVTNAFPNGIWEDTRNPTSADFRSFDIGVIWINTSGLTAWIMVDKTNTSGTWVQMASTGTGILTETGNSGGTVGPDGSNNINVLGSAPISVAGNAGTNTLTISSNGTLATTYTEDAGSATPSAGVLKIVGTGGVSTSGAGNTVTITTMPNVPTTFVEDLGSAVPALNILNILGGTGVKTSGAGSTVTIAVDGSVVGETITGNSGGALSPVAGNWNIVGGTGVSTAGAGNTLTINTSAAIATSYPADSGTAIPSGGILNVLGAGGTVTSGAGNTLTITSTSTVNVAIQTFTTSGTYTPTAGMSYCIIECLGGGGAGGGAAATNGATYSGATGGSGGEYARGVFTAAAIGASKSVTIGAGGSGSAGAIGGNGGNTSVGALISAFGGQGGNITGAETLQLLIYSNPGGTGGAGGNFRTPGGVGQWGFAGQPSFALGGTGADSQYGAGGNGNIFAAGNPGLGYGSGGGGTSNGYNGLVRAGGNGASGIVIITEYF